MSLPAIDEVTAPTQSEPRSSPPSGQARIAFFGIFGIQNLGNECTLQAILHNARKALPDADVHAISFNPTDTVRRHRLDSIPVSLQIPALFKGEDCGVPSRKSSGYAAAVRLN